MPRSRTFVVVAVMAALSAAGCTNDPAPPPTRQTTRQPTLGTTAPTSSRPDSAHQLRLTQPLAVHRATVLADGRVLITGGCTEPGCGGFEAGRQSELFDPATGHFTNGPLMLTARASGTATLLDDGRVLLTGGYPGEGQPPSRAAEVFDPTSSTFEPVGPLTAARADHSATALADGRVLVAGGFGSDGQALASTETFNPASDTFSPAEPLSHPRAAQVAVRVGSGVVLIGGTTSSRAMASTDVWNHNGWAAGPTLSQGRIKLAAITLRDDRVLVVGGAADTEGRRKLATTEVLDISAGTAVPGPPLHEGEYKLDGAAALLADGRIAVAGGSRIEVFDPRDDTMARLGHPVLVRHSFLTATAVGGSHLLIAGGYDDLIRPTDQARLVAIPPPHRTR